MERVKIIHGEGERIIPEERIPNTPLVYDRGKRKLARDSITNVSFSAETAYKYVNGTRKPVSVRVDEGVYLRFKPLAKRLYGSVCRALEVYMVSLIEMVEKPANICGLDKPVHIDKIVIERNLRSRRKLVVEEEVSIVEKAKPIYSKLPSDELRRLLDVAEREGKVVDRQLIAFELNRRNVKVLGAV